MLSAAAKQFRRRSSDCLVQRLIPPRSDVADRHNAVRPTNTPSAEFLDQGRHHRGSYFATDAQLPMNANLQHQSANTYAAAKENPQGIERPQEGNTNNQFEASRDPQPYRSGTNSFDVKYSMGMNFERSYTLQHVVPDADNPRWIARSDKGSLIVLPVNPKNARVYDGDMVLGNKPFALISNFANTLHDRVAPTSANAGTRGSSWFLRPAKVWIEQLAASQVFADDTQACTKCSEESTGLHQHEASQQNRATQDDAKSIYSGNNQDARLVAEPGRLSEENKTVLCNILVDGKLPRRVSQVPLEVKNLLPLADTGHLTSVGSKNHPTHCVPCDFWNKRLCNKGATCAFCHIPHPGTVRAKPSKQARHKRREHLKANVCKAVEDGVLKRQLPVIRAAAKE
eukprot:GEMP01059206.1.p1 GENE.GEMP01059206.1~~GEMP01059206.1.p1  ORF type:complete len:398 (+),score=86.96 GEMP01059206.1:162-1355(+)